MTKHKNAVYGGDLELPTVTIASGSQTSAAINIGTRQLVGILVDGNYDGTSATFEVSDNGDQNGNFFQYDYEGSQLSTTVAKTNATTKFDALNPAKTTSLVGAIKVISSTAQTSTSGASTVTLYLRPLV